MCITMADEDHVDRAQAVAHLAGMNEEQFRDSDLFKERVKVPYNSVSNVLVGVWVVEVR